MNIITTHTALRELTTDWQQKNQRIAFVPTMGNLHEGHLTLVKKAHELAERVVVSIFVNPMQFGPNEDFLHYPRTLEADIAKLKNLQVDVVFTPEPTELYPNDIQSITHIRVPGLSEDLCGKARPGHFDGVSTVVAKLFHMVAPNIALFGQKDFQQLAIIKKMAQDLNFPIEVLSVATVRESDGLALSSRNQYLNTAQRKIAPKLYATLNGVYDRIKSGDCDYEKLCTTATTELLECGFEKVDYVAIRDQKTLKTPTQRQDNLVILAAAFLGKTRLIDNIFWL